MIGETPNPDDEDTYRQTMHPSGSPPVQVRRSVLKDPEPFNISGDASPPL